MSDNMNNNKKKYQTRSSKNKVFVELGSNRKVIKRKINDTNDVTIKNKRNRIEDDDDFIVDDIEYVSSDESWLEDEGSDTDLDSETDEETEESSIEEDNIRLEVVRSKLTKQLQADRYPVWRDYRSHIKSLALGIPPCVGIGISISRLLKVTSNLDDIRLTRLYY